MTFLLLYWRQILVGGALAALVAYGAVQKMRLEHTKAEYAKFRAEVAAAGAEAEVRTAQTIAEQAQHAQEALDDLQARNAALGDRYERLRNARPDSSVVPTLSEAAGLIVSCPGDGQKPDAATRRLAEIEGRLLAILEVGDRELAKYKELWSLGEMNAAGN